jgi:hypothetical protein
MTFPPTLVAGRSPYENALAGLLQLKGAIRQRKHDQGTLALEEQRARTRETELSQALYLEESKWTEFIARLEQLTRK